MCSAGGSALGPPPHPVALEAWIPLSPVAPLAWTTAVIFQLALLRGGVWEKAEPLREPLWELGWGVGGPWPGHSSSPQDTGVWTGPPGPGLPCHPPQEGVS